jgi:hypothetical protein
MAIILQDRNHVIYFDNVTNPVYRRQIIRTYFETTYYVHSTERGKCVASDMIVNINDMKKVNKVLDLRFSRKCL